MKRFIAILLAATLLFALAACGDSNNNNNNNSNSNEDRKLTSNGISITLPSNYDVYNDLDPSIYPDIAAAFSSSDGMVAIYVIKEDASDLTDAGITTAHDYLEAQNENSTGLTTSVIKEKDGVEYYTYSYVNTEDLDVMSLEYLNVAYKSSDAFWLVQFCCSQDSFDKMTPDFIKWAKTVTFD